MKNYIYVPGLSENVEQEFAEKKKVEEQKAAEFITVTGAKKKQRLKKDGDKMRMHKDDDRSIIIPVCDKYALTIKEAAGYYNIAESRLRDYLQTDMGSRFALKAGSRLLVKRVLFEEFLNENDSI